MCSHTPTHTHTALSVLKALYFFFSVPTISSISPSLRVSAFISDGLEKLHTDNNTEKCAFRTSNLMFLYLPLNLSVHLKCTEQTQMSRFLNITVRSGRAAAVRVMSHV